METIRMIWIALLSESLANNYLVSFTLYQANEDSIVLLIFQEQVDHRVSSSTIHPTASHTCNLDTYKHQRVHQLPTMIYRLRDQCHQ